MWYVVYNILLVLASPVIIVILLCKKRSRPGMMARLGIGLDRVLPLQENTLWIHAVSLGEATAIVPLVKALHHDFPVLPIVVSTVTETGRETVEKRLAGIAQHCYLPLDFPWVVSRYVRMLCPCLFVLVETELWPNLLRILHFHHIPTILVNGRLSSHSFQGYQRIALFIRQVLAQLDLCLMQSERDADRVCQLGAEPGNVHHTGNMKFDQEGHDVAIQDSSLLRASLGLRNDEMLIVAGSTHAVEEEQLVACYRVICQNVENAVLLLAPRHIERTRAIKEKIQSLGMHVQQRSQTQQSEGKIIERSRPRVIILDTRGELAHLYGLCRVAFVGGTLVPVGGHNLLEPAVWGKPVVFGPYTDHCAEMADLLVKSRGGVQVHDDEELTQILLKGLQDDAWIKECGAAARSVVIENQGVIKRNLEFIRPLVKSRLDSCIRGVSAL